MQVLVSVSMEMCVCLLLCATNLFNSLQCRLAACHMCRKVRFYMINSRLRSFNT